MLSMTTLDGIANQAIHLMEFRLLTDENIPESIHKTIKNIGAKLRDDIIHHPTIDKARFTEKVIEEWNRQTARGLGIAV